MQDYIFVSVSPFYNGHGWTDHGTGIDFKPVNGLRAFRIDLKDNQDLRGIRNSIRLNHLLLLEGELPEMGEVKPEDANPAELTHKEYTTLLEGLRSDGDNSELVSELETVKTNLATASGRITELETNLDTANSQVTQLNSQLQSTKTELENTEAELTSANGENTRLKSELDGTKAKLNTANTNLNTANNRVTQLESELQTAEAELNSTKTNLGTANSEIAQLESKLQTAESDLADKDGEITQLQADIKSLQDELAAALAALEEGSDEGIEAQSLGYTREELEGKTVAELQQLAEDENIELTATLKADIIQEILDAQ